MKTIEEIGVLRLKEHIIKNWMTHDAMWFLQCIDACGIDEANRLNKAVIKEQGPIELGRACCLSALTRAELMTSRCSKTSSMRSFLLAKAIS